MRFAWLYTKRSRRSAVRSASPSRISPVVAAASGRMSSSHRTQGNRRRRALDSTGNRPRKDGDTATATSGALGIAAATAAEAA